MYLRSLPICDVEMYRLMLSAILLYMIEDVFESLCNCCDFWPKCLKNRENFIEFSLEFILSILACLVL